jgi:serine phosphatase RsbU (regulator of sigma subunit)
VIADVTDKGTGAALYMAMSRTLIRTFAVTHYPDPVAALTAANLRLLADSRIEMFVTVFFGILDPASGQLAYCNAGHNPPYIFSGAARALTQTLRRTGTPLGVLDDVTWEAGAAHLAPGDVFVLYTDGVTEAQNAAEEFWGEAQLQATTLTHLGQRAAQMRTAILADIHAFVGRAPQSDDITLMVIARE